MGGEGSWSSAKCRVGHLGGPKWGCEYLPNYSAKSLPRAKTSSLSNLSNGGGRVISSGAPSFTIVLLCKVLS